MKVRSEPYIEPRLSSLNCHKAATWSSSWTGWIIWPLPGWITEGYSSRGRAGLLKSSFTSPLASLCFSIFFYKLVGFASLLYKWIKTGFVSVLLSFNMTSFVLWKIIGFAGFADFICNYFTQLTLLVIKLLALNSPLRGANLICIFFSLVPFVDPPY